jgi:hypothetical protein
LKIEIEMLQVLKWAFAVGVGYQLGIFSTSFAVIKSTDSAKKVFGYLKSKFSKSEAAP